MISLGDAVRHQNIAGPFLGAGLEVLGEGELGDDFFYFFVVGAKVDFCFWAAIEFFADSNGGGLVGAEDFDIGAFVN